MYVSAIYFGDVIIELRHSQDWLVVFLFVVFWFVVFDFGNQMVAGVENAAYAGGNTMISSDKTLRLYELSHQK